MIRAWREHLGPWRLQLITHLAQDWKSPWTNQTARAGSRLTLSSVIELPNKHELTIPVPNATALMLNCSARAGMAAAATRAASKLDSTLHRQVNFECDARAFDYIENMIEAIIFALMALEAFANETIPDDFKCVIARRSKATVEPMHKADIEKHVTLDEKLSAVLPQVLSCATPKGRAIWENYLRLRKTRDRLVHLKSEDRRSSTADVRTAWSAIFQVVFPHRTAKAMIDHYVKAMSNKPMWWARYPLN